MRRIGVAERRARLVAWHRVGTRSPGLAAVTEDLIALHATDAASVYLAAWARIAGLSLEAVDDALYESRTLVRMLGMRRTMFVVPASLRPVIQSACTDQVAARLRRALIQVIEDGDIATNGDRWLRDVTESVVGTLTAKGPATGAELGAAEPRLRQRIVVAAGKSYGGEFNLTSRILNLISAEGEIVRGRPRGGWTSTQYEWSAAADWLGEAAHQERPTASAARADLARRWLRAFGPAPVSDLQWWAGWTGAQTKDALRQLDLADADLDGRPGVMLADDEDPPPPGPGAALLPALDPTPMGWQGRGWFLEGMGEALFDRSGNIGPTIFYDGRIVGGWAQRPDGDIVLRLLEDLGTDAVALVETEAERLREWLGHRRFVAKFRTPLERELSSG
jgi:hypothetical protein